MNKVIYIIIFTVGIFFIGCKDNSVGDSSSSFGEIVPLQIGNLWEYSITNYDTSGMEIYNSSQKDSVESDTTINNILWYKITNNINSNVDFLTRNQTGFGYYYYNFNSTSEEVLVYKYPCKVGDTYENYQVINVNVKFNLNSKEYECIQYRQYLDIDKMEYWDTYVSPGIGIVKMQYYNSQKLLQEFKLINYVL